MAVKMRFWFDRSRWFGAHKTVDFFPMLVVWFWLFFFTFLLLFQKGDLCWKWKFTKEMALAFDVRFVIFFYLIVNSIEIFAALPNHLLTYDSYPVLPTGPSSYLHCPYFFAYPPSFLPIRLPDCLTTFIPSFFSSNLIHSVFSLRRSACQSGRVMVQVF